MEIKTAVVAAAGSATRMWPSSKAMPKELFPLGRVPAIVHLVWEFQEAGIQRVIIVASDRSEMPLRMLLDPMVDPPESVRGFPEVIRFQETLRAMEIHLIRQEGPYGNGTPLLCSRSHLGTDEPIVYAFGDDIVFGENPTVGLIEIFKASGLPALAAQEVASERTCMFGIVEVEERGVVRIIRRMIEKPQSGVTSSRLAVFGRYLVVPGIIEELGRTTIGRGQELWLTDALVSYMGTGKSVAVHVLSKGQWVTVGDPKGYLEAVRCAIQSQS